MEKITRKSGKVGKKVKKVVGKIEKPSPTPRKELAVIEIRERWGEIEEWAFYKADIIMETFKKLAININSEDEHDKNLQFAALALAKIGQLHDITIANAKEMGFWGKDHDIYREIEEKLAAKLAEIQADAINIKLPE